MATRQAMWEALGDSVELLVVGGGITGAGIARDAAKRGLKVALAEMNDLAFGTSSRSSKLVHGGLRYLEHYEFSLVFEAVSERRILQDIAPHLVNPLGFLFPVYKGAPKALWLINAGMWLYDGLSLFRSPKIHKNLRIDEVKRIEPALNTDRLKGAPLYYDCSTDDARLTIESALDAERHGAVISTWTKVVAFEKDERGRIHRARLRDELSGEEKWIATRAVINATGPWTDATVAMSQALESSLLRPTKGVHIVVDAKRLPLTNAVVCFHPTDGRVLFAVPWGDRTYLGTTDTDYEGDPAEVAATSEDVEYLINASRHYFPDNQLDRADVISTWAGIRPLMAPQRKGKDISESSVSREHQIIVGQDGLITIAGGKLTTYRRMAAEVVDTAVRMLELSGLDRELDPARTDKACLPGAEGWPDDDDHGKVAEQIREEAADALETDSARHLADAYGMRGIEIAKMVAADASLSERLVAGRPEVMAQVDWGVLQELAATLTDVMVRRTQLFFRDVDQGLGAAEHVANRMAELLGWNEERRLKELEQYRAEVARSRAWQG